MKLTTIELTNRLIKFCKRNELEIEDIVVKRGAPEGWFSIELEVVEGD